MAKSLLNGKRKPWAKLVGDNRWSWFGVLPYFKKSKTFYPAKSNTVDMEKLHGFEGPIKVRYAIQPCLTVHL
jgi:hypothetical protein